MSVIRSSERLAGAFDGCDTVHNTKVSWNCPVNTVLTAGSETTCRIHPSRNECVRGEITLGVLPTT